MELMREGNKEWGKASAGAGALSPLTNPSASGSPGVMKDAALMFFLMLLILSITFWLESITKSSESFTTKLLYFSRLDNNLVTSASCNYNLTCILKLSDIIDNLLLSILDILKTYRSHEVHILFNHSSKTL